MSETLISENEAARLEALHNSHLLNTPIQQGFERITRLTKRIFDVPIAAISLVDEDKQWLKSVVGLNIKEIPRHLSFCNYTILEDKIMIVEDAQIDPRFADNPYVIEPPSIRFYAGFPVYSFDEYRIGTLAIMDNRPRQFSNHEKMVFKDLAAIVDSEIDNYQMLYNAEMQLSELGNVKRATLIDPLTKLWNKEGILHMLEVKMSKNASDDTFLAVLNLSVDSLQSFIDEYGKSAGDDLLQAVAQSLVNSCRSEDAIGYTGGKEFIILVTIKQKTDIHTIANRIQKNLQKEPLLTCAGPIRTTATLGISLYDSEKHSNMDGLLEDAHSAMLEGKQQGGNKVIIH